MAVHSIVPAQKREEKPSCVPRPDVIAQLPILGEGEIALQVQLRLRHDWRLGIRPVASLETALQATDQRFQRLRHFPLSIKIFDEQ